MTDEDPDKFEQKPDETAAEYVHRIASTAPNSGDFAPVVGRSDQTPVIEEGQKIERNWIQEFGEGPSENSVIPPTVRGTSKSGVPGAPDRAHIVPKPDPDTKQGDSRITTERPPED